MKVSVVINTYNRLPFLKDALRSLQFQTYTNFEVVVVNGPSQDGTKAFLQECNLKIKTFECSARNLSRSRNIGIRASSGTVVAFLDDDAVAHQRWIERLVEPYFSENVGAVGGFTFDHTGREYQSTYTISDRLGDSFTLKHKGVAEIAEQIGSRYPSLLGANSSFRADLLRRMGGFDEVFEYFLDETDVCCRIVDMGYKVVTAPEAYVFHRYAPSHTRDKSRIPKTLFVSVKSKTYFCYKHSRETPKNQISKHLQDFASSLNFSNRWHLDRALISSQDYFRLENEVVSGIEAGSKLGKDPANFERNYIESTLVSEEAITDLEFQSFNVSRKHEERRKIAFISQGYPPNDTSGIARWTQVNAEALSNLGHEIHVITRSTTDGSTTDYLNGVWVHQYTEKLDGSLPVSPVNLPGSIHQRAAQVYYEVKRIQRIWGLDLVSGPIWDVEAILCRQISGVRLATSLHTTYALMRQYKKEWITNLNYDEKHVRPIIEAEHWLMANSDVVIANSSSIVEEIENHYPKIEFKNLSIVPHGIRGPVDNRNEWGSDMEKTVLFVGRIENRKGLDILLRAILLLPDQIRFTLRIAGATVASDVNYVDYISSLLDEVRKKPGVKVEELGYVNDDRLDKIYRDAYVVVIPSRYESFGLVVIEAMSYGSPVIAARVGGMKEIYADYEGGLYFEGDSADSLAKCLLSIVNDTNLRASLASGAMEKFNSSYTDEIMARAFLDAAFQ